MKTIALSICLMLISLTGTAQKADTLRIDTLHAHYKTKARAEYKKILPNVPWAVGTAAVGTFFTVIDGSILMGGVTFGGAAAYFTGAILYRAGKGTFYRVKGKYYKIKAKKLRKKKQRSKKSL